MPKVFATEEQCSTLLQCPPAVHYVLLRTLPKLDGPIKVDLVEAKWEMVGRREKAEC